MDLNPISAVVGGIAKPLFSLIDELFTSDDERAAAKLKLMSQEGQQKLAEAEQRMSAIIAEANSKSAFTSGARPAFFYVFYIFLLSALPFAVWATIQPENATAAVAAMKLFLEAIPDVLYGAFTAGFLGYGTMRTVEKVKGVSQ